jgi:hypothetical protein
LGNDVQLRNDLNQATGNFSAVIVKRSPKATVDPEQELTTTANFPNKQTTNATGVLSFALTGTAGNIITVNAPAAQIVGQKEGTRNGIRVVNLDLQLNANSAAGEDEFTIVNT